MSIFPQIAVFISVVIAADPLPYLYADPDYTTVSGMSSGGFMTSQVFVMYSDMFQGAGIIAGGPYDCVQSTHSSLLYGLTECATSKHPNLSADTMHGETKLYASGDMIARTRNL